MHFAHLPHCPTRDATNTQIMGTLIFEVYHVLRNYGSDISVWRQSFHDLTSGGVPRSSEKRSEVPAPATTSAV